MRILIDGMGGDNAPEEIVKGAVAAAKDIDHEILIIGPEGQLRTLLAKEGAEDLNIDVINATEVVTNDEHPAMAVRKKKDSTITKGMTMLRNKEVDVFISAGSTGALLSAGLFNVGRIKGIKRPGIATFFPKIGKGEKLLLLDCGASVDAKPEYLLQFGIMGTVFMENVAGVKDPTVMLLNVGAEEAKGDELHREAHRLLKNSTVNFIGNIEGRDIPYGVCDIVVTDGFSGNVFLKSAEGVASSIMHTLKELVMKSNKAKIGMLMAKTQLESLKREFDYSEEGGAPILGLKGAAFKMHGSSDRKAVYNAILKSIPYVENNVNDKIEASIIKNMELSAEMLGSSDSEEEA